MSVPELAPTSSIRSSHLAFALLWLPRQRRQDALLFYRFCRTIDDIVDDPQRSNTQKQQLIQAWLDAISCELPSPLECLIERYKIDRSLFSEIVRGCEMDISLARYPTFSALEKYCWRVACAVGLVSLRIFGCKDPQSHHYAENLGYALQLTNILRDVAEDARMGRIYLPLEDLEQFEVKETDLLNGNPGHGFLSLMRFESARAKEYFKKSKKPLCDTRALLPAEIMRAIYLKILHRLEIQNFPVFKKQVRLSRIEKLITAIVVLSLGPIFSFQRSNVS